MIEIYKSLDRAFLVITLLTIVKRRVEVYLPKVSLGLTPLTGEMGERLRAVDQGSL